MRSRSFKLTTVGPLVIGATLGLAFVAMLILGIWAGNAVVQQVLTNTGHDTMAVSGRLLFNPLFKLDVTAMDPIVNQLLSQESIVYVAVRDQDGTTVIDAIDEQAQDDPAIQNFISQSAARQANAGLSDSVDYVLGPYLAMRGPISAGSLSIGALEIVFDQRPQQVALQQSLRPVALAGVVVLLGAILVAFLTTRYAMTPLRVLTDAAKVISEGNLNLPVPVRGLEETSTLGATFEGMRIALKQLTENLERKVEERTAELVIARRTADEANRLKSEFLATMSHELRTPLNAMIGFTEIMIGGMGGVLDDDALHMTERIHANSLRLLALINDVLDLSKIEAQRLEVVPSPFSPRDLAVELQSQMASLAAKKSLEFEVSVDAKLPPTLIGDKRLIERVATNLLSNAFKFTERGRVRLSLDAISNNRWLITVADTGAGIPPHALEYIFEPFRQVDGSSQRAYGGSGLGLAIVREITRAMDGSVQVESALGRGSTFTVTLPLVVAEQPIKEIAQA